MNINRRISVNCFCIMLVTSQSYMACMALVKEVTSSCCSGTSICKQHCANSKCGERFRFFSNSFPDLLKILLMEYDAFL